MSTSQKSSVEEIRQRFDQDVERFSNLETGQVATIDSTLCMELVAEGAAAATPNARRALDVGCGAGNYSLRLRQRLPEVRFTLADLSEPMLVRARQRLGDSADTSRQGDIRELEFPAGQFDVILCASVLHHLRGPEEWESVFGKFHHWLTPGGSLWVFDLVTHEDPAVQNLMWQRYGQYLESTGGAVYREKVFAYVEREDTPRPVTWQLDLLRRTGFARLDVLHKNGPFAAYGAVKG